MTPPHGTSGKLSFASLGSGSKGNATLVSDGETHLLIDCGFGLKEAERRLGRLGLHPRQLEALLVTHEHGDHLRGVGPMARKHGLPVYMTPGTWMAGRTGELPRCLWMTPQSSLQIKGIEIEPITVPHDAREPVQFRLSAGGSRLGLLTDLGYPSHHVVEAFRGCDALVLECNHDPHLLENGPYPPRLKRRVAGRWGHLANQQAAWLMRQLGLDRLQHIVCSHLSEHNNRPELAREVLEPLLDGDAARLAVAAQETGLDWRMIR
ncbi:MBL fold metallo-hydrolase [Halomonas almeriensis]|uniref:MBL fold metallo-hydrolase n=1 Tax=Halomonas almeriensis TaxID=308163 RepID=UPI0025B3527B|nr:MBL fold metallo-hydrolase [Halomonas almeriensis]MDN3553505.1 MBL fold metallo-hydrolase [Halomonas almeriensis]